MDNSDVLRAACYGTNYRNRDIYTSMEQCTPHKEVPSYGASYESDIILSSFSTVFGHGRLPSAAGIAALRR